MEEISDEIGLSLVNTIYLGLNEHPDTVGKYYDKTATLTQKFCDEDEKTVKEKFENSLIKGEHVIMRCDCVKIADKITVHASGYLKKEEKFYQSNEMFVFKGSSSEHLVLYQNSYFIPVQDPKWKPVEVIKTPVPEPKPEPEVKEPEPEHKQEPAPKQDKEPEQKKAEPSPVEVANANELIRKRTVLCQGLPTNAEPSWIIRDRLAKHGTVTKYFKRRGQIFVEFENPESAMRVINQKGFQWKGKAIKVSSL